jgi:hypothetical protein
MGMLRPGFIPGGSAILDNTVACGEMRERIRKFGIRTIAIVNRSLASTTGPNPSADSAFLVSPETFS